MAIMRSQIEPSQRSKPCKNKKRNWCGLTLLTQRSPEAEGTQADVAVCTVSEADASVRAADQVAHTLAALTCHRDNKADM